MKVKPLFATQTGLPYLRTARCITPSGTTSLLVGNRIPKDFFVTQGHGESDIAIHAGSYHLALKDAGIEMCNIMTYSSILPAASNEIERPPLEHGAVLESIMAMAHSTKGRRATAGIAYGWLHDRKTGDKLGGLVCEHTGCCDEGIIEARLQASIEELYENGFSEDYDLSNVRVLLESFIPQKRYGTALVALCFTSYVWPVLQVSRSAKSSEPALRSRHTPAYKMLELPLAWS